MKTESTVCIFTPKTSFQISATKIAQEVIVWVLKQVQDDKRVEIFVIPATEAEGIPQSTIQPLHTEHAIIFIFFLH